MSRRRFMRDDWSARWSLRTGIRFVATGLGSTATHVVVAVTLVELELTPPGPANGAASCVALLFSFMVNTKWTFASKVSWRIAIRFFIVALVQVVLSFLIASAFEAAGLNYLWGIACVATVVPAVSFLLHAGWTYATR